MAAVMTAPRPLPVVSRPPPHALPRAFGRRRFGQGLAAAALGIASTRGPRAEGKPAAPALKLGLASYSLRKLSIDELIAACQSLGLTHLTLKEMHLPREPEALAAAVAKYAAAGITVNGVGVINMKNEAEKVRQDFLYARAAGAPLIIAAPEPEALDLVESLVKEFGLPVAIHNHGPEDKHYPGPSDVMKHIAKRDKRIGVCMDVGHTVRAGEDPVALVSKLGPRLMDLHIKDLKNKTDKASQVEAGQGAIDLAGLMKALHRRRYAGQVGLEYEIHPENPLPGIRASLAYLRGVKAGLEA